MALFLTDKKQIAEIFNEHFVHVADGVGEMTDHHYAPHSTSSRRQLKTSDYRMILELNPSLRNPNREPNASS